MFRRLLFSLALLLMAFPAAADSLKSGIFQIDFHADDRDVAERSLPVLVDALHEFAPRLKAGDAPIRVVLAHTEAEFDQYARQFGKLEVSGVTHSSTGTIAVKAPALRKPGDDYRGTLRHELVHVLLYRNANTDRLPRWLNEGICMSLANEFYWGSMFQVARMFVGGRIIEYRYLDGAFGAPGSQQKFGDAYAQALSMTRWLRDHLGEDAFWRVVTGTREMSFGDAMRQYGQLPVLDFWQRYQRGLWFVALIGSLSSYSDYYAAIGVLALIAWWRIRVRNQRKLDQWTQEEAEAAADQTPRVGAAWEEFAEDPDAWKQNPDEDGDEWKR